MGNTNTTEEEREELGIKVICISDTHGLHRNLNMPLTEEGINILLHGGDFTKFSNEAHLNDFNDWLGELPYEHKIIVNGNHEHNSEWHKKTKQILTNATFLNEELIEINGIKIWGSNFYWPCPSGNPYYAQIPTDTDVVIAHGPAKGFVDNGGGCPSLTENLTRIKPRLFVCGHIHGAHGETTHVWPKGRVTKFVNAANCKDGYTIGWEPVVVTI